MGEEMDKDAQELIVEAGREVAKDVYKDGLQPSVKRAGDFLGTVFGVFDALVMPIKKWILKCDYSVKEFEKSLQQKYNDVPEDNRKEPDMSILGNSLEALRYNIDKDELRELFENIIISSMDSRTSAQCHPSYVDVIKQLSVNDAIILRSIKDKKGYQPLLQPKYRLRIQNAKDSGIMVDSSPHPDFPDYYIGACVQNLDLSSISKSLHNLHRLGLIKINTISNIHYTVKMPDMKNATPYDSLKKDDNDIRSYCIEKLGHFSQVADIEYNEGSYKVSEFGEDFISTCVR